MKHTYQILIAFFIGILFTFGANDLKKPKGQITFEYKEVNFKFSKSDKRLIERKVKKAEKNIRKMMPSLPQKITVILAIMDRDINIVGGTTGRTQKHDPDGQVYVYISNKHPKGVEGSIKASLNYLIYHEFHHLARGWAMEDNKYEPGIDIAMVNEGLAVVFGEDYTKTVLEGNAFPEDVESWVEEVLELPQDANYYTWMNMHPDGRLGIGYKCGHYVIRKAMKNSNKSVLELSEMTPPEILKLAGY